jgi:hypothetical protein
MSSYSIAKLRYISIQSEVMGTTLYDLQEYLPSDAVIKAMSGESDVAWYEQWRSVSSRVPPNGGWDWPALRGCYGRDPKNLCLAMWARNAGTLCGLMIARLNQTACAVERIEASPLDNHPFRHKVLMVGLDAAARYAQASGRRELWVMEPANENLTRVYVEEYGFESCTTSQGLHFCRRKI